MGEGALAGVRGGVPFTSSMVLVSTTFLSHIKGSVTTRFTPLIKHRLPGTSLTILLRYLILSTKVRPNGGRVRMVFICSRRRDQVGFYLPSSLRGRIRNVTFRDHLNRFTLCTFRPSSVTHQRSLFARSLRLLARSGSTHQVVLIPSRRKCKATIRRRTTGVGKGSNIAIFNVGPPTRSCRCSFRVLKFTVLRSLNVQTRRLWSL